MDAHTGDDFIFASDLKELLVEDIVLVGVDEGWDVPDDCEDVELIPFDGVVGEEDVMKFQIKQVIPHGPHHLVGLHVVHVQDVQVVKTAIKRLTYLKTQVHHCVENSQLLKLHHSH